MPRFSKRDRDGIAAIRGRCQDLLVDTPAFPEVVGDRKIIRFLTGHDYNIDKATEMFRKFLLWRRENDVDAIRQMIIFGGMDHPTKFPKADIILKLMPCLAIAHEACDKMGSPICVDQYDFEPSEVIEKIGVDAYYKFFVHVLEFKSIILEQIGEKRDREYLASLPDDNARAHALDEKLDPEPAPWGNVVGTLVIRDLKGVGFRHIGPTGQEIIKLMVTVSSDNYPELLRKSFLINSPWIFTSVWYVIKGWVAAKTASKIQLMGGDYMGVLKENIDEENIPVMLGGVSTKNSSLVYEPFEFDKPYFDVTYKGSTEADRQAANIAQEKSSTGQTTSDITPPIPGE